MPGVTCYVADKEACRSTRKPRAKVPPSPKFSARSIVVATTPASHRTSVSPRWTIAPASAPSHVANSSGWRPKRGTSAESNNANEENLHST